MIKKNTQPGTSAHKAKLHVKLHSSKESDLLGFTEYEGTSKKVL